VKRPGSSLSILGIFVFMGLVFWIVRVLDSGIDKVSCFLVFSACSLQSHGRPISFSAL